MLTWKNVMWLNHTSSPVTGWRCTASRIAVVRSPPAVHSTPSPLPSQYAVTAARSSVLNACCHGTPKSSWKLRTTRQRRRVNSSRTSGSMARNTWRMSASGVAPRVWAGSMQ